MRRTDKELNEVIDLSETIDFKEEDTQIKKKQREKTTEENMSYEDFYAEALAAEEGRGNLIEEFKKVCEQFNIKLEEEKKKETKTSKKNKKKETKKKDKKSTKKKTKKPTKKKNKKKGGK